MCICHEPQKAYLADQAAMSTAQWLVICNHRVARLDERTIAVNPGDHPSNTPSNYGWDFNHPRAMWFWHVLALPHYLPFKNPQKVVFEHSTCVFFEKLWFFTKKRRCSETFSGAVELPCAKIPRHEVLVERSVALDLRSATRPGPRPRMA